MRRVSRATSPTAVKVSEEPPGSCFRELDDVFLQTQTRIWLGEVLQFRIDEEMPIANLLADGELLFKVSKVVWKKLLKNHVELKNSKLFLYEHTSFAKRNGRYMPYPKVDSFLKICQILGLTGIDLFSPSDVVEKRDVRRVCMCVRSFSKKARLKCLSVPDFDIVKYTIAMPTDLVGGICRSLEQSRCSLSSSSYGMDFRRVYGKKGGNAHHDHNHENGYESDEAESRYTELEFESSSPHASFRAADIFNFDPEDYPQIRSVDDDLSKLHGYFELEDQTHENNQQDKDIILESVGSTFGSIIESDNSGIQISGINCYQSRCLSHVNFPSKVESFMGENQYISFDSSVSKTCLTKPSTSNSLITTVPANGQIMETFAPANKEINSTIEEHDNMAYESRFQNKKLQEIPPICMLQSEVDSKTSCCSYSNGCTSSEGYVVDECIRCALCETSYETSDISGANYVSNHELYSGNVNGSLETGGREAINSKIVCYYFSRDQLCMEFTDTYHANEVTSDWIYISGSLSTSESAEHFNNFLACAPRESGDACFSDRGNFSCLNPGILTSLKGDISSEKDLKIEDGSHFIKDVGTITSHIDPDNTEERKKIMEGHEENLMATSTLSETRVKNTGKRVLKSFVGSISLIGALLVFLHLRKKRDKERSSHTAVPLPPQQTYQKVSTNKKVEIINYHQRYPGERLKL